jgi:2-oxoacid:acceptor oxidoreductase gamma subunit (pyruvate/2-ketoisovalerate family)
MERELILTGVGGQGVQLAAQVLAKAAVLEGRFVMLLGTYGGTMRGGNTDSTLVVADAPITAPPIVSRVWSVVAMHHQFWGPARAKLRPGSVVVVNHPVFAAELDREVHQVFEIPATELATQLGQPMSAAMLLVAATARITGLVGLEALVAGMRDSVPPYRRQHVEANEKALRAGFAFASPGLAPAWPASEAA